MTALADGFEMVVGLEVHTELKTATKLFCGCPNEFGSPPNTNVCPVCLGLPGSLPVLNVRAVELAMAIGAALGCEVRPSSFHRKNYFYPDMPKDYQISQYDEPINVDGTLTLPDGSVVGIVRAHLEEDTGKTTHLGETGRIHGADRSLVDYNRSGVPLVEIVSAPDLTSAAQAQAYAAELRAILKATGASDGRMEEGSMRVDANVSVRRVGDPALGTRCEVKNLNSLRSLERAVDHEAVRQVAIVLDGGTVAQETRHWDEGAGATVSMRSKEEAYDYRYFPEPDLLPLAPDDEWRDRVAAELPALPAARRAALLALVGDATPAQRDQVLSVVQSGLDDLVAAAVDAGVPAGLALARVANEVAAIDNAADLDVAAVTSLLVMESAGELSATQAKAVLGDLAVRGGDPRELAAKRGFERLEVGQLTGVIDELVAAHPDEWTRYAQGDDKLAQFFVGLVMKSTNGQADGKAVIAELARRRSASMRLAQRASRRAAIAVLAVLAVGGLVAVAALSAPGASPTHRSASPWRIAGRLVVASLNVRRCPTSLGAPNPSTVTLPRTQRAEVVAGSEATLTAFTDGAGTLDVVAPAAWRCTALDAVDGSSSLIVFPPDVPQPEWGRVASVRRGIVASQTGACVGCSLQVACRLFPGARGSYVRLYGVACRTADGRDERRTRISPSKVLFVDPPGVEGAGRPSGGGYAAMGAMLWHLPGTRSLTAFQETCTLPAEWHDVCVVSVRAFLARHPH